MSDPIVGIDLGTSNSVVARTDEAGQVQVLADDASYKIHPSVVSFHPNGGVIVGAPAKQRKVIDPANTVYSAKRLIGRRYNSPEVQTAKSRLPYLVREGSSQMPMIVTRAGEFAVPEISAIILDHLKRIASQRLDTEVRRAVITVPASFNDAQRSATATAGAVAGLTVVRVLNEPTAAALAYGHTRGLRKTIAVYDFGGGTFDVTILKLHDQVFEVLGTAGDTFLGGDDLDECLVDKMVAKFLVDNHIDLRTNEVSMMRLRAVAEQTKIELSRRSRAVVRVDEIAYGPKGVPLNLQIELTRDELVTQIQPLVDRTFPVCDEALALAGVGTDTIDDVILVGGTTKIPYVRDQVSRFFNKAPRTDIAPEEAVAVGAALQAAALERTLDRKRSGRISAVHAASQTFGGGGTDTIDEPLAGTTEVQRRTNPYSAERPATEYSVKRGSIRDEFGVDTQTQTETVDRTTLPPAVPLARMTQTMPRASTQPPTAAAKAKFGVPDAPRPITENDSAVYELEPSGPSLLPKRSTAPASVPPPPRMTQATPVVPPPMPIPRPPAVPSGASTAPTLMAMRPPAPMVPMSGVTDLAGLLDELDHAQPTTPEIVVPNTAPGVIPPGRPPAAPSLDPASTAKGFAPPQSHPVTQAVPVMPPMPAPMPAMPAPMPVVPMPAPIILDVTPRSLGIGTVAGFCEELIRRNAQLPAEARKLFTTSRDRQEVVNIVICQGESRRLDNNMVIGDLTLDNLPPRPRGETSIEVTFSLDASGILRVRARDAQTGNEQRASLDLVGSMSEAEISASRSRLQAMRPLR